MVAWLLLQLWTSHAIPNDPTVLLNGTWQTCREADGYGERIYEYRVLGVFQWELHMGPLSEFGIYETPQPDEHDHTDSGNLLGAHYRAEAVNDNGTRVEGEWDVPTLHLHVSVKRAGGSRDDCDAYVIQVRKS